MASIYMHYSPFALRGADWRVAKDILLAHTLETLDLYAPGIRSLIVATEVITPPDLQVQIGLSGGHMFHGEARAGPVVHDATTARPCSLRQPNSRAASLWSGHAPGRVHDRDQRPAGGTGRLDASKLTVTSVQVLRWARLRHGSGQKRRAATVGDGTSRDPPIRWVTEAIMRDTAARARLLAVILAFRSLSIRQARHRRAGPGHLLPSVQEPRLARPP